MFVLWITDKLNILIFFLSKIITGRKDIWSWFFQLADDMSNQTTPRNGTWPANQMNSTHYLNGTEVPTQAPFITNGTIGADPTGDDPNNPFGK